MKKVILSVAAIATTFLVLSFAPVEKNTNLAEADLNLVTAEIAVAACTTKYEIQQDFSRCDRDYVPPKEIESQQSVLDNY